MEATREQSQIAIDRAIANHYATKAEPLFVTKMGSVAGKTQTLSPDTLGQVENILRPQRAINTVGEDAVRTAARNILGRGPTPIKPTHEAIAEEFKTCGDWFLAAIRAQRKANQ